MMRINVLLKEISVLSFDRKEGAVLTLSFEQDGKKRHSKFIYNNQRCMQFSENIMYALRKAIKDSQRTDDDSPFSVVNVLIDEEDECIERISRFLESVSNEMKFLRGKEGMDYLNELNRIECLKKKLEREDI